MPETAPLTTPRWPATAPMHQTSHQTSAEPTVALSAREAQVIGLIVQGLSNTEIAATVFLSINSVKTYIRTAYRKIGVTRRAQAVVWGMTHGFAPDQGNGQRPD